MDFEQDYIMRMIKQMVAGLISILLGKENKVYESPLEEQYQSSEGLLRELLDMANCGKINEAENLLYEKLQTNDKKSIQDAILFYSYLNGLDDEYLTKNNFSRDEINSGLSEISRLSGMGNLAGIFNQKL